MSITIIVPTVGRRTLQATLESIWLDSDNGDLEVLVLSDGAEQRARRIFEEYSGPGWRLHEEPNALGCWGHTICNLALDNSIETSHVYRIDDDDVLMVGAIPTMLAYQADVPVIFRARWGDAHPAAGVELPHMHEVRYGNIATPMVLAPVCKARYGMRLEGDFDYAVALIEELGEPLWRDDLIALIRPEAVE